MLNVFFTKSGSNRKWEVMEQKAKIIENMTRSNIRQLKCNDYTEKFDKDMTMDDILKNACKQLKKYVNNLKDTLNNYIL